MQNKNHKEDKKARYKLLEISNRTRSAFSFGKLKTFKDLYTFVGEDLGKYFASELNTPLTYNDVKEYLSDRHIELETSIWLRDNPPQYDTEGTQPTEQVIVKPDDAEIQKIITEEEKDYGYQPSPHTKAFLFWFQKKAVVEVLDDLLKKHHRGELLVAATGSGKTFIAGALFRHLLDINWHQGKTFTPWPYVYVTKAAVVEQTKRVFRNFFNIDPENEVLIINIEQLRSEFGKRFVKEEIKIHQGEEEIHWIWRNNVFPVFILLDECQTVKNSWSQQSKIFQSYNDIESEHTTLVSMSATPLTKVSEAKVIACSTRVPYQFGVRESPLCNSHWTSFAEDIASNFGKTDTKPEDNSPAAVDRLMSYIDKYVVRIKGIKYQFHANNRVQLLTFDTPEGEKFYNDAWETFLQKKSKLEGDDSLSGSEIRMNTLAALTIFRIAAESNPDRVRKIAKEMYHAVQEGRAAVASVNFKITICKIVEILVKEYKIPRSQISLIWGGAPKPKKKAIAKAKLLQSDEMMDILANAGITLKDLDLDEIEAQEEDKWVDPELKLGAQSQKQRQEEIDRFQNGKALYCLYTFRAGGVGLSLHHCDELTKEKVRRRKSGYAFEDDIPNIPTRPRINFVTPTYSAIELVQGLGRCPRLTSLSHTEQILMFYAGTIEERVAHVVSAKLRCLTKVVRNRESWEDIMVGRDASEAEHRYLDVDNTPEEDTDALPSTDEEDDE